MLGKTKEPVVRRHIIGYRMAAIVETTVDGAIDGVVEAQPVTRWESSFGRALGDLASEDEHLLDKGNKP